MATLELAHISDNCYAFAFKRNVATHKYSPESNFSLLFFDETIDYFLPTLKIFEIYVLFFVVQMPNSKCKNVIQTHEFTCKMIVRIIFTFR